MKSLKTDRRLRAMALWLALVGVLLAAQPAVALVKSYTNKVVGNMSYKSSNALKTTSSDIPAKISGDTNVVITPTERSIIRANFCGEFSSPVGGGVAVIAVLDPGTPDQLVIHPGTIVLDQALPTTLTTRCFEWVHFFVDAGPHVVEIQWASLANGEAVEIRRRTVSLMSQ